MSKKQSKHVQKPTRYWAHHCKRINAAKKVLASYPYANLNNNGALGVAGKANAELASIMRMAAKETAL